MPNTLLESYAKAKQWVQSNLPYQGSVNFMGAHNSELPVTQNTTHFAKPFPSFSSPATSIFLSKVTILLGDMVSNKKQQLLEPC